VAARAEVITAVQAGDAGKLRSLLDSDPALGGARDENGVSALMHALYRQRPDLADLLRAAHPELDIFEATSLGRSDLVEDLLERDPRLAHVWSGDGFTALHFAAFFGQESCARVLLEYHADAGAIAKNAMQVTPLHSAAAGRNLTIVRALLEHGASVNARQQQGWTALHEAAQSGDQAMVELLLKHGANPNARNDSGVTPEELAESKGHEQIAERLRAA
jgi:ankyrin repeat protein